MENNTVKLHMKDFRKKYTVVHKTGLFLTGALLILASGCVKDDLYNTPHPDKGAVVLDVDGLPNGDGYTVDIDGQTFEATGSTFAVPDLFDSGTHTLTVYNRPEGFSVEGFVARVSPLEAAVRSTGGFIHPLPGYLHSGTRQIEVMADNNLNVEMSVSQRVRDLRLELTLTEGDPELIKSVTGTLAGIAGAFDLAAQKTTGEAVTTVVAFTRTADKLTADARLLGVIGAAQTLRLEIGFTDRADIHRVSVDLSEAMKGFDDDMTATRKITGSVETPVGADEVTATITGWQDVYGDPTEAE